MFSQWFKCTCVVVACLAACGKADNPAAPDALPGDAGTEVGGGAGSLRGVVSDRTGAPVNAARVAVAAVEAFSDNQGRYTLPGLPAGPATLTVTRNWFAPFSAAVTVAADATSDVTLDEIPLALDPADRALAEGYAATFDPDKQSVSIAVAAVPTRRAFDNAVYFRNPALVRDTSQTPPVTPSPAPEIAAGLAKNFTFPLAGGPNKDAEALELSSIRDKIGETPLGATEPAHTMMWSPMITWLGQREAQKTAELKAAAAAIRQQTWKSDAIRPQEIEKAYLDGAGALWVKVVFATFVTLGPGIADDDGDGRKEIYARLNPALYPQELVTMLTDDYGKRTFTTFGLSKEVGESLNELYSSTGAQVERYIGEPYVVPGVGTIKYPFVVLRHAGGQRNVILVAPGP